MLKYIIQQENQSVYWTGHTLLCNYFKLLVAFGKGIILIDNKTDFNLNCFSEQGCACGDSCKCVGTCAPGCKAACCNPKCGSEFLFPI